ncbi:MAG TPA: hypothetical protein VGN95_03205 [Pyrinomonadaceae bacterium]|jgi:hypothetical protein|nr:hypothetical protein [Pyrinomonadaceae bacterium]
MVGIVFNFVRALVPTLVAVSLGFAMFEWHSSLTNPDSSWGKLLEHLGLAFWVTGIVILLYEYGAKEKEIHESLSKLNKLIALKGREQMVTCFELLFKDEKGKSPAHLLDTRKNLENLVNEILELQQKKIWAKDKYIGFLNYLLTDVVLKNASNLVEIGGIGHKNFHVPLAAEMADRILTAQISAMGKGHTYDVISDLSSWQNDQLSLFREETKKRVGKKVKVRRVFIILNPHRILDRMVAYDDAASKITAIRKILELHLRDSSEWGMCDGRPRYKIKVLGTRELETSAKRKYLEDMDISKKHFGLFNHGDGIVQFTVTKPDLSDMALSTDPNLIEDDLAVFNAVWDHASTPLTQEWIDQIILKLELIVGQPHAGESNAAEKMLVKDVPGLQ